MARIARIVFPGIPHLIFQQGREQNPIFLQPEDYKLYIKLLAESCSKNQVQIWAYCLLPGQIHLIAVPKKADGLARGIGEAHRQFSVNMNQRSHNRGNWWRGRFSSTVVDDQNLSSALRYVMGQPIMHGLCRSPFAYAYSSAKAYLKAKNDLLVDTNPLSRLISDWRGFLSTGLSEQEINRIRLHKSTGKPLGKNKLMIFCGNNNNNLYLETEWETPLKSRAIGA